MMIAEKNSRVALVLDPTFGDECLSMCELMPVWIIDSPGNRAAVEKCRRSGLGCESGLTTFRLRKGESGAMACERIVQSLDEHHNEHSQTPGYAELIVVGVSLGEVSREALLDLNFNEFRTTASGFIAKKKAVHSSCVSARN